MVANSRQPSHPASRRVPRAARSHAELSRRLRTLLGLAERAGDVPMSATGCTGGGGGGCVRHVALATRCSRRSRSAWHRAAERGRKNRVLCLSTAAAVRSAYTYDVTSAEALHRRAKHRTASAANVEEGTLMRTSGRGRTLPSLRLQALATVASARRFVCVLRSGSRNQRLAPNTQKFHAFPCRCSGAPVRLCQ